MQSARYCCQNLIILEWYRQIFEKCRNIKFHQNPSSGSRGIPYGRTDGHESNNHSSQICESTQKRERDRVTGERREKIRSPNVPGSEAPMTSVTHDTKHGQCASPTHCRTPHSWSLSCLIRPNLCTRDTVIKQMRHALLHEAELNTGS
jgi:hypothetical protein